MNLMIMTHPNSIPIEEDALPKGLADYIQCYLGMKGQWKMNLLRNVMGNAFNPHSM